MHIMYLIKSRKVNGDLNSLSQIWFSSMVLQLLRLLSILFLVNIRQVVN